MPCPMKEKQLNKWHCCCWCCLLFDLFFGSFWFVLILFSFVFVSFSFVRSLIRSINWFIFITFSFIQSNSILFVVTDMILTTVYLLYASLSGSTVCLLHDVIFYPLLIVLPVELVTDMLINKTTPRASSQEQSFWCDLCEILYREVTVQLCLCLLVSPYYCTHTQIRGLGYIRNLYVYISWPLFPTKFNFWLLLCFYRVVQVNMLACCSFLFS